MVKFYGDFFISPVPEIVSCDKFESYGSSSITNYKGQ